MVNFSHLIMYERIHMTYEYMSIYEMIRELVLYSTSHNWNNNLLVM